MNSYPLACNSSLTAAKSSGAVTTSYPSSSVMKSSAPASNAASINSSSDTSSLASINICPLLSNMNDTHPLVPKLPPFLSK